MEYLTGRVRELEDIIEGWEHTAMMAASAGTKVDACNIVDDYICQLSNKE